MALTDKLTAIGNAIRAKTGKTAKMTLDEMATEIRRISTSEILETIEIGSATLISDVINADVSFINYTIEDDLCTVQYYVQLKANQSTYTENILANGLPLPKMSSYSIVFFSSSTVYCAITEVTVDGVFKLHARHATISNSYYISGCMQYLINGDVHVATIPTARDGSYINYCENEKYCQVTTWMGNLVYTNSDKIITELSVPAVSITQHMATDLMNGTYLLKIDSDGKLTEAKNYNNKSLTNSTIMGGFLYRKQQS